MTVEESSSMDGGVTDGLLITDYDDVLGKRGFNSDLWDISQEGKSWWSCFSWCGKKKDSHATYQIMVSSFDGAENSLQQNSSSWWNGFSWCKKEDSHTTEYSGITDETANYYQQDQDSSCWQSFMKNTVSCLGQVSCFYGCEVPIQDIPFV